MKNLVPIGRFSRICRLTIPALRLYDELGLLRPAAVDRDTGYRYYSVTQSADAERIRRLRAVDMPLDEIRSLIGERDRDVIRALLLAQRRLLEERATATATAIAALDGLIEMEDREMNYEVTLREVTDQPMISVRGHTPLAGISAFLGQAFGEEFGLLARLGVRPAGPPFSIYHDPDFREDDVDVEVGVPVAEPVAGQGRVSPGTLPAGMVACTLHAGPYEEIGGAYRALAAWMQERGHESAGAPREVYLVGMGEATVPADLRTEVLWPIR